MPDSKDSLPDLLAMAFVRLNRLQRQEKSPVDSLSSGEIKTLLRIREMSVGKGVRTSDISNSLQIAPPSLTHVLATLENKRLISRAIDSVDRRVYRIRLTETGEAVCQNARMIFRKKYEVLIGQLGRYRSIQLLELLEESLDHLQQQAKS